RGKPCQRYSVHRGLCSTGYHDVSVAQRHQSTGVTDRVRPGRTGGDHSMVRPFETESDRYKARSQIDDAARNKEWVYSTWAPLMQGNGRLGNPFYPPNTGTDHHSSSSLLIIGLRMPTGVVERLASGTHGEDYEFVDLALFLRLHPLVRIVGRV